MDILCADILSDKAHCCGAESEDWEEGEQIPVEGNACCSGDMEVVGVELLYYKGE